MPLKLGAIEDALLDAGASAEKAGKAAEELAGYVALEGKVIALDGKVSTLTWMVGTLIALQIALGVGNVWLSFTIMLRLADLAGTVGALAARLPPP